MALQFVQSEKGKRKLLDKGHLYIKDKENSEKVFWKCDQSKRLKCRARVHSVNNEIVQYLNEHNHAGDAARCEVAAVYSNAKFRATNTQDGTHRIVADSYINLSQAAAGQMPRMDSLKRTIRNVRNAKDCLPATPNTLSELQIPELYQKTFEGEQFLLFDSNDSNNRILIFSTKDNLNYLSRTENWYADGTFKTVPSLFQQLYTIHAIINNKSVPAVFALLSKKSEEAYTKFFDELKRLEPNLAPKSIMIDFEQAAINGFKTVFPGASLRGCFFHFTQCFYRCIQQNGLQKRYQEDSDFALKLRMIPALAFIPVANVECSFEDLCENVDFEDILQPVLDYFEDTWIGRPSRRCRRNPRFPLDLWNCHSAVQNSLPKTNNSCEGWYRSFTELIGAQHAGIWKFIAALKREQSMNSGKIEQYISGCDPNMSRKKYRDCAKRIEIIVNDYPNRTLIEFLRGIAQNYNF